MSATLLAPVPAFFDDAGRSLLDPDPDRHAVVGSCWPNRSTTVTEFRGSFSASCGDCGETVRARSLPALVARLEAHAPGWATEGTMVGRSFR